VIEFIAKHLFRRELDDYGRWRKGTWSQSYSGGKYYPIDPRSDEVAFDDVCMGLREPRYRAQTRDLYTVLEHSVLVSIVVEQMARERGWPEHLTRLAAREGLMHDGSEAYIGDVTRPLKRQWVMWGYRRLERKWMAAVYDHFGIRPLPMTTELVEEVDNRIVLDEVEAIYVDPDMWYRSGRAHGREPLGIEVHAWTWSQAVDAFCQRFTELWPEWEEPARHEAAYQTWSAGVQALGQPSLAHG
jgi:hypothetical protein